MTSSETPVRATKWQPLDPIQRRVLGVLIEKAKTTLVPVVKLSAPDSKTREAEVTVEGVPPGIGIKVSPERVKVAPVK